MKGHLGAFLKLQYSLSKGRVRLPNRMNFWKSAKEGEEGGGAHFQSKNLNCRFWELETGLFEHEIDTKE